MSKHIYDPYSKQKGIFVEIRNSNYEAALKILKKKVNQEGILKELRKREGYEKPGDKRRRKQAEAIRRTRKAKAEADLIENS